MRAATLALVRRLHSAGIAGVAAAAVLAVGSSAMLDMHQEVAGSGRYAGPSICEHESGDLAHVPGHADTVKITYDIPEQYGGGTDTFVLDLHTQAGQSGLKSWLHAEVAGQHLDVHYCWNEVK